MMKRRLDSITPAKFRASVAAALGGVIQDPFTIFLADRYARMAPDDQDQIERQAVQLCKVLPISALQALELLYKVSPYTCPPASVEKAGENDSN